MAQKYQLFDDLRDEEYTALEADIVKRGVMVPIEVDEDGNVLDGHNRLRIADKHNLECEEIVREFTTETEKREHIIKLNLARRHLSAIQWGQAFKMLLETKGVKRGRGKTNQYTRASVTITEAAKELGVNPETAKKRLQQADQFEALPKKEQEAVDAGEKTLATAVSNGKPAAPKSPPKPPPEYPESDALFEAIEGIVFELEVVEDRYGGFTKLLKSKGWDSRRSKTMLGYIQGFAKRFKDYEKEIKKCLKT